MAGFDFEGNTAEMENLAGRLDTQAKNFSDQVIDNNDSLFNIVYSIGSETLWQGEDYNAFVEGMEGYSPAIRDLASGIKMYATHMRTMSTNLTSTIEQFYKIAEDMTGSTSMNSPGSGHYETVDPNIYFV